MADTKMSSSLGGRQVHRKLTIEMFQSLLKADSLDQVGTTIPENGKLDFHEDMYQLQSLNGINMVCSNEKKSHAVRDGTIEFMLSKNQLTSLLPLAMDEGVKMFAKMEKIDARYNTISAICAEPSDLLKNEWPYKMVCLVDLDLSHNQLSSIPNLKTVPNLKILKMAHNKIRPPWKQLKDGKQLEHLELHENRLDWEPTEFVRDIRVLRYTSKLRKFTLCDNPFCKKLPNYRLYVIHEIAQSQRGIHLKTSGSQLEQFDNQPVTKALRERALNQQFTKDGFLTVGDQGEKQVSLRESKDSGQIDPNEKDNMDDASNDDKPIPTIASLTSTLEDCFAHPTQSISKVHLLMKHARIIMRRRNKHDELFRESLSKADCDDEVKKANQQRLAVLEFLQHMQLLMQRQPQLMPSLLRVLANLAAVGEGRLGDRCLEALQDVMKSGTEEKDLVIEVMNECVIPQLKATRTANKNGGGSSGGGDSDEIKVRKQLTAGMERLADGSGMGQSLSAVSSFLCVCYFFFFSLHFFPILCLTSTPGPFFFPPCSSLPHPTPTTTTTQKLVDTLVSWMSEDQPDVEVISMCAVATSHPKNAIQMAFSGEMWNAVMRELRNGIERDDPSTYYKLIRIATNMSQYDCPIIGRHQETGAERREYRSAQNFIKRRLHERVLQKFRDMVVIKKPWDLAHNQGVARLVDCLAALSLHYEGLEDLLQKKYLETLIQVYNFVEQPQKKIHPVVVTAVFRALLIVLQHDFGPKGKFDYSKTFSLDHNKIEIKITKGLHDAVPLLRFLNEDDHRCYRLMCTAAFDAVGEGGASGGGGTRVHSLRTLHNRDMCDLLESVINLVSYYCEAASAKPHPSATALQVSQRMNENDRETFLFDCILCPSDKVRLAVVDCLYHVPLSQLDEDETSKLVNMLNEQTNISAGETEVVIAKSFDLLTKMILNETEKNCREFRMRQAEHAIRAALDILGRNSDRDTRDDDDEDAEKFTLSHSCVTFLRACSVWGPNMGMTSGGSSRSNGGGEVELRQNLINNNVMDLMRNVLCLEDKYSRHYKLTPTGSTEKPRGGYRPVIIERTYAGSHVDYLLHPFQHSGIHEAVERNGVVAPRLYRRMADVLMGAPDPSLSDVNRAVELSRIDQDIKDGKGGGGGGGDGDRRGGGGGGGGGGGRGRGGDSSRGGSRGGRKKKQEEEKEQKGGDEGNDDAENEDGDQDGDEGDGGDQDDDRDLAGGTDVDFDMLLGVEETMLTSMHPQLESTFASARKSYAKIEEDDVSNIERSSIDREMSMPDWWFESDDPLTSGRIKEIEGSTDWIHRKLQHSTLVQQPHTLANIIIFLAKTRGGGGGGGEEKSMLAGDDYLSEAFHAKSYVADLQEQISKLMSLEQRRKNAFARLERNRLAKASDSMSKDGGSDDVAEESAAAASAFDSQQNPLSSQSKASGRTLLLQAFMMEQDDTGTQASKIAGSSSSSSSSAGSGSGSSDDSSMSVDEGSSVNFAISTEEHPLASLVASALRVFFALLRFGFPETKTKARLYLSDLSRFRRLANVTTGKPSRPMWWSYMIGGKFLSIAQEIITLDPVSRSAPTNRLELYAITCRYARGVLRGVIFQLEHKTDPLNFTDMKMATMAACAAATVARQLPHVVLPRGDGTAGQHGPLHKKALEYLFSLLFPQTVLTAFIRILLYDMNTKQDLNMNNSAHVYTIKHRRQMREAIVDICIQFLTFSERNRYMVLEQLCREEFENDQTIRQALLQDMLRGVSENVYNNALQGYMQNTVQAFQLDKFLSRDECDVPKERVGIALGMTSERIVQAAWVGIIEVRDGVSINSLPQERLLVLTNHQVSSLNVFIFV